MSNVGNCAACGRELRFYTLRMDPREAPEGDVWCQRHDPKWAKREAMAISNDSGDRGRETQKRATKARCQESVTSQAKG